MTEKIRRRPYSVVLFDEIEKAHPEVWNMLLQIMEEGRLTDNVGRTVDFKNSILIMTTNIGAEQIAGRQELGLHTGAAAVRTATYDGMKQKLKAEMEQNFRPEFLNRVDDIIVFRSLTKDNLKHIIDIELSKVSKRLKEKNLTLVMTDEAKDFLIEKGTSLDYGARPLRRAIEHTSKTRCPRICCAARSRTRTRSLVKTAGEKDEKKLIFDATTHGAAARNWSEAGSSTAITTG